MNAAKITHEFGNDPSSMRPSGKTTIFDWSSIGEHEVESTQLHCAQVPGPQKLGDNKSVLC